MESEILVEEWSPMGNIQAFVEKTERTYYFYLWINPGTEDAQIRSCWICNRIKGPKDVKEAMVVEGQEPCMPAEFVVHDPNGIDIDESNLSIQWMEEGDAAALLSGENILAYIPSFSGMKGFYGYSIYAKGTGPFAWEMKQAYASIKAAVDKSKEFWDYFDTDYWRDVQNHHMDVLTEFFGKYEKYYAIDGNRFPPKALVTGRKQDILYAFTLGVSLIPMPTVEMNYGDDYRKYRRIELGLAFNEKYEDARNTLLPVVSYLSAMPWKELTHLGHGHTVPYDGIDEYIYILFINANEVEGIEAPAYNDFMGDRINLLWLKPITEEEYDYVVENGVAAYLQGKDPARVHIFG